MNIFEVMQIIKPGEIFYAEDYEDEKDYQILLGIDNIFINGFGHPYVFSKEDLEQNFIQKFEFVDYLKALEHLKSGKTVGVYYKTGSFIGVVEDASDLMEFTLLELHHRKFVLY